MCVNWCSDDSSGAENGGAAVRAGAVRFDFASLSTEGWCVLVVDQDRFADFFESSAVLLEEFVHRDSVCAAHGFLAQYSSGRSKVVCERSASVMTQSLSPAVVR